MPPSSEQDKIGMPHLRHADVSKSHWGEGESAAYLEEVPDQLISLKQL